MSEFVPGENGSIQRPTNLPDVRHFFADSFLRLVVRTDPLHFVPDDQRADAYLHLDRSQTTSHPDVTIPLGRTDSIRYVGEEIGGVNGRGIGSYQAQLFPDEFEPLTLTEAEKQEGWSVALMLREAKRRTLEGTPPFGYDAVFSPGKTVLDVGSGQAVGLMQLVRNFKTTAFIGVDSLYERKIPVFPKNLGLQLTRSSWVDLAGIPTASADTLLSLQGIGAWGLPGSYGTREIPDSEGIAIAHSLTRVAKPGAVLRMDIASNSRDFFTNTMQAQGWNVMDQPRVFLAQKMPTPGRA